MRIISGTKKGHSITSIKNIEVRPISDKNRETIFNILVHGKEIINSDFTLEGCNLIDLFAGTGSFSFEALSRGSHKALLIENNNEMIDVIYKNAKKLDFLDRIEVKNQNACSFDNDDNHKFDLAYVDPPYGKNLAKRSIRNLIKKGMLNDNAIIVLEEEIKTEKSNFDELELIREKQIGISNFSFYKLI